MPFLGETGTTDPKVEIRQVGPNAFQLMKGFRYREPARRSRRTLSGHTT